MNFKGQFVWYELVTFDVHAALEFYGHVVGWTVQSMPTAGGGEYQVLHANERGMGGMFELTRDPDSARMQPGWVGYIGSQDVDADAQRLKTKGGKVHRAPTDIPRVGRFAPVADPQGAGFILFNPQPPQGEIPQPAEGVGAVGWAELHAADWKASFAFYSEMFGWKKAQAVDMGMFGTYQVFSTGAAPIGGMMNRMDSSVPAHWLYFFIVDSVEAAAQRVKARGGEVVLEPQEVPGGSWILKARDPQGALFALTGPQR